MEYTADPDEIEECVGRLFSEMEIKNAKVSSCTVGCEDYGIMTMWLQVDYGGASQGFGGWALSSYNPIFEKQIGTAFGLHFIMRVLDTLKVDSVDKLKGKPIRVKIENGLIVAIADYLEDNWFNPKEDKELQSLIPKKS